MCVWGGGGGGGRCEERAKAKNHNIVLLKMESPILTPWGPRDNTPHPHPMQKKNDFHINPEVQKFKFMHII